MQVTAIKESGCSNTLRWALKNGARVWEDDALCAFISDETFYLITISDINFFELFRLTQIYRDKLRILQEHPASVPNKEELEIFSGEYITPTGDNVNVAEAVELCITTFMNLATQMRGDDDIISSSAVRLFIPMIARRFDIQIPLSFYDFMCFMSEEEREKVFTTEYPNTINDILEDRISRLKINIMTEFVKSIKVLSYSERYEKYLNLIKYAPLKAYTSQDNLYKFGLLEMFKMDNIRRSEVKAVLFKSDKKTLSSAINSIAKLSTDLKLKFVIQLPIQYMQMLLNYYDAHILPVEYESSMHNIVSNGLVYENFKTFSGNTLSEESSEEEEKTFNNQIEAYRVRITEANQILLNTINMLLSKKDDEDSSMSSEEIFALLPAIYKTNAVLTINARYINALSKDNDNLLGAMFTEIRETVNDVANDIQRKK